jgi:hypothetical protein
VFQYDMTNANYIIIITRLKQWRETEANR